MVRQTLAQRRTLSTPFCRLTIISLRRRLTRDQIGHRRGVRAFDRDQDAGRPAHRRRVLARADCGRGHVRSSPSTLVRCRPCAVISAMIRGRASNVTSRPASASSPPTKQPILPAPATTTAVSLRRSTGGYRGLIESVFEPMIARPVAEMHDARETCDSRIYVNEKRLPGLAAAVVAPGRQRRAHRRNTPSKTVTLVVPFAAGGSNDIVARAIGKKLGEAWGQTVIIDNRAGAGGVIGATCRKRRRRTDTRCCSSRRPTPSIRR